MDEARQREDGAHECACPKGGSGRVPSGRPEPQSRLLEGFGMSDKAWKQFERRVAAFFKTERNALSGGNSKLTRSDTLHPDLFIECKQRKKFAAVTLWDDTKRLANKENKTPVVCLSEKGRPGFWLLIHSDDFTKL